MQLRDLAAGTPLPREGGVLQTNQMLADLLEGRHWDQTAEELVRYYFLVARMEKSRDFSREFARRRDLTEHALTLMQDYIAQLNRAIARAVFVPDQTVEVGDRREFPLTEVGWVKDASGSALVVLHRYPEVETQLGRQTLRDLRELASADLELLEVQLSELDDAERLFLEEIHLVGQALAGMRPRVTRAVKLPRAGLPFSL